MIPILSYVVVCAVLAIIDCRKYEIPNFIVLPAIAIGSILTGNIVYPVCIFLLGAYFFKYDKYCGGDVKLMTMIGAFLGWQVIPIFFLTWLIVHIFRVVTKNLRALPLTPFALVASVVVIFTCETIKFYL